jgi:hypothetical protein
MNKQDLLGKHNYLSVLQTTKKNRQFTLLRKKVIQDPLHNFSVTYLFENNFFTTDRQRNSQGCGREDYLGIRKKKCYAPATRFCKFDEHLLQISILVSCDLGSCLFLPEKRQQPA